MGEHRARSFGGRGPGRRGRRLLGILLVAFAVAATACGGSGANGAADDASTRTDELPQWLFAHSSDSAEFTDNGDGSWEMTLIRPDESLVAFTDRPVRDAAMVAVADLVDSWAEWFGDDPPNGAVTDQALEAGAIAVTLDEPRLGTDPTSGDATLVFTATVIADEDGTTPTVPSSIAGVSTLIDPPAARLTDFHQMPLSMPAVPVPIPHVGGPTPDPGEPDVVIDGLPADE